MQSFDREKKPKAGRRQNEPENPPRKEQGKIERARRKKRGEEKRGNGCTLSFLYSMTSLKEKNCLRGERYFGCNVIQ